MATPKQEHKKFILLIEDEEIMVGLLQRRLERAGYLVKVARDGVHGLEMIHEFQPDLVLLDMMLPRLNGFGVLEKLYEERIIPKLPVMIISNSGQEVEIERAQELGIRDHLVKVNFDPEELVAKVDRLLANEARHYAADGAPRTETPRGTGEAILLVEDDQFLNEMLEKKFSQQNFKTYRALDAKQAHAILDRENIDLILLDIVLPGKDGITFLKELKEDKKFKKIPVIIVSNLGQPDSAERGKQAGAADYIIKANASPNEIVEKVEMLLNASKK